MTQRSLKSLQTTLHKMHKEEVTALKKRVKELEKFVTKVAYGPPRKGEPITLLNTFVDAAQKLVPKE